MQIGINKKDWLHTFRFKSIDVWVSPLPFLKREIAIRTHFPLNRVKVLPIGVNTKEFEFRKYTRPLQPFVIKSQNRVQATFTNFRKRSNAALIAPGDDHTNKFES